jgi:hypothetical protein
MAGEVEINVKLLVDALVKSGSVFTECVLLP